MSVKQERLEQRPPRTVGGGTAELQQVRDRNSLSPHEEAAPRVFALGAFVRSNLAYVAWLQALVATASSLYFSEVMRLPPCVLCWYQRIAMYPLVVVLTVAIVLRETRLRAYVLPLSLIGFGISAYHNLLYYGVIPEGISTCTAGVSCTARQIEWFGFVAIPLMALVAFSVISASVFFYRPEEPNGDT